MAQHTYDVVIFASRDLLNHVQHIFIMSWKEGTVSLIDPRIVYVRSTTTIFLAFTCSLEVIVEANDIFQMEARRL